MFKIKEETLQKVVNYMAQQPYAQVFQLIAELQQLEKIEEKETKK